MVQNTNNIVSFISENFFLPFAIYSIIFFTLYRFNKDKKVLKEFDKIAIQLTIWVATIWILLKITGIVTFLVQMKLEDSSTTFSQNLSWFIRKTWFQIFFWIILSQLLRIKYIAKYLFPRILIAFFLSFSFEKITMLLINIHRDYLPESVNLYTNIPSLIAVLLLKTLIFTLIVSVFYLGKRFFKNDNSK
ncbi:hypothetical protein U8527_03700 [Kordia algicida OT-1]|uniref:Uncharacterized protein n=1 Tax=Kordia algicida OT-1 TaxID=391587 RepID=A9DPF8_9FLAO|nr:hypothetical protein [Kordia algicida]EDP97425.1 hypothetical protein KAOT1_19722 [Kordia algicida OT-1]